MRTEIAEIFEAVKNINRNLLLLEEGATDEQSAIIDQFRSELNEREVNLLHELTKTFEKEKQNGN